MENKIYAAYGSNMNLEQMKYRCPNAKVIEKGEVINYKLTFRGRSKGVANIERSQGRTVPIVLWEITSECEKALDLYEGYPRLYVKRNIKVVTEDGVVTAMVYVMAKDYEKLPAEPSRHYLNIIWTGYVNNEIPLRTLREAVAENQKEISDIDSENRRSNFGNPYFK
jgi:gamma-glutamylcyclotransferase (GGCT)/AIG2-like uncharacterized protein YtfP